MEASKANFKVKLGIVLSFLSLIGIVLVFEYCSAQGWTTFLKAVELAIIVLFFVSFYLSFIKTGLWRFTHKSLARLDERELIIINRSLRYGYAFYSIFVLSLLLLIALLNLNISIVLAVAMIIFSHLVPASIIGYSEKYISYRE